MEGGSTIFLSELISILSDNGKDSEKLKEIEEDLSQIRNVEFSNPELVEVEEVLILEGEQKLSETDTTEKLTEQNRTDWRLVSLAPFQTDETLTITLKSGETVKIPVTDYLYGSNGEAVTAAGGSRVTADKVTYTLSNNGTGNGTAVVYAIATGCTFHDSILYKNHTYTVTNIRRSEAQLTANNMRVKMDFDLIKKIAGYSFNLPEVKKDLTEDEKEDLESQGFVTGGQNSGNYKMWKKAEYNSSTNSIEYTMKYFQSMKDKVPLDFIFIYDDSSSMYSGTRTSNGVGLGEAQTTRVLILDAVKALMPDTPNNDYDIKVYLGGTSTGDKRKGGPFASYSEVENYLSEYRTGATNYGVGLGNALALAQDSVNNKRKPVLIWLSDFHQAFSGSNLRRTGDFATADKIHKLAQAYCLSTDLTTATTVTNIASSGSNIYKMSTLDEGVKQLEIIIKDAIGYYMKDKVTVTDNLSDALKAANVPAGDTTAGSAPAATGKSTWTLGGTSPYPGAGTLYEEKFSVKLDDNAVYTGAMPTNGDATVYVGGKEVNKIVPNPDDIEHLHVKKDVTFVLGQMDVKDNIVTTGTAGEPSDKISGIKFTLRKQGSDSVIRTDATDENGFFTTDANGSFSVSCTDNEGNVIFNLGETYILQEDPDSVDTYNEGDSHETKLVKPDKAWIITVAANGTINIQPDNAANQTPEATVWSGTPAKFVLWNQVIVQASLIPVTVQKTWPDADHPHDPVPFTIYGVDPSKDYAERQLTAYDSTNALTATKVTYIDPNNPTFREEGNVWTQTVYVPDKVKEDDSWYKFYDFDTLSTSENHNYKTGNPPQDVNLEALDELDGVKDGTITYNQRYSYVIKEGNLVYPYGWYTPDYPNNVSSEKKYNDVTDKQASTSLVAYDGGSGSTTVNAVTLNDGSGALDGTTLTSNFEFHLNASHFEFNDKDVMSYADFHKYFGTVGANDHEVSTATELKNFYDCLHTVSIEFTKDNKQYVMSFTPDHSTYGHDGTDIAGVANHDGFTFRNLSLPSTWANNTTNVTRKYNAVTTFKRLNGISITKITATSNIDTTKSIIMYSSKSGETSNKMTYSPVQTDTYGGSRSEFEVNETFEMYHRHSTSYTSQSLTRKEYTIPGTNPKPLTDTQYNKTITIKNQAVLSINNTWTNNTLVPVKVKKEWKNGDSGSAQPYGEDIYNAKQNVVFSLKGKADSGKLKDIPIFTEENASWYTGGAKGSATGTIAKTDSNKNQDTWEQTFYVPKYDTDTYNRSNEPNPCEEYKYTKDNITENDLTVDKDADGEPKGEWKKQTSYTAGGKTTIPGEVHSDEFNYDYDKSKYTTHVKLTFTAPEEYKAGTWYSYHFEQIKSGGKEKIVYEGSFKFSGTVKNKSTVYFAYYERNDASNWTRSKITINGQALTVWPSSNSNMVNVISQNTYPSYEWKKGYKEEDQVIEQEETFTLTNTYTPYKAVNLASVFDDQTGDRESSKDIGAVKYVIKKDGEVFRTVTSDTPDTNGTNGNKTKLSFLKEIYLPKGNYTIEQRCYNLSGEDPAEDYATTAFASNYQVKDETDNKASGSGTLVSADASTTAAKKMTVSFDNERKSLPVIVQTHFDPALDSSEVTDPTKRPLGTDNSIQYAFSYLDSKGETKIVGRDSSDYALSNEGFDTSDNNYRKNHGQNVDIPSYSIRAEIINCDINSDTSLEEVLPDYDTFIDPEEKDGKMVFTIEAGIKRAPIIIEKTWDEEISAADRAGVELTFAVSRSDTKNIYGTDKNEATLKITSDEDGTAKGTIILGHNDESGADIYLPILRQSEINDGVRYVLREVAKKNNAEKKYYPTFTDESGREEDRLEQTNPAGKNVKDSTLEANTAKFVLTEYGINIDVNNADSPYICKIVETFGEGDDKTSVENPFRRLNAALKYARENLGGTATIEMLVDYEIPGSDEAVGTTPADWAKNDRIELNSGTVTVNDETLNYTDNITITTAATSSGVYNFVPTFNASQGRADTDSTSTAIIVRGFSGASLFTMNDGNAEMTFKNIVLDGNKKNNYVRNGYNGDGGDGGLIWANGTLNITDGAVLRNSSTNGGDLRGGAVYMHSGTLKIDGNAKFLNNQAAHGGAIHIGDKAVNSTIEGSALIQDNIATGYGGGINVGFAGEVDIKGNVSIEECSAQNGGGLNVENNDGIACAASISGNAVIKGCTATDKGGAVYIQNGSVLNMSGGEISGNSSTNGGAVNVGGTGARLNFSGTPRITGNTDSSGQQKNIYLNIDQTTTDATNGIIYVVGNGLESGAHIGVYVPQNITVIEASGDSPAITQYDIHGAAGMPFGTFDGNYNNNLNCFVNDINSYSGTNNEDNANDKLIYWAATAAYLKLENKSSQNPLYFKVIIDGGKYGEGVYKKGSENQDPTKAKTKDGKYYYEFKVNGIVGSKSGGSETIYLPGAGNKPFVVEVYTNENLSSDKKVNDLSAVNLIEGTKEDQEPETFDTTAKNFNGTLKPGPKYKIKVGDNEYLYSPKKLTDDQKKYYNSDDHKNDPANSYVEATKDKTQHIYIYLIDAGQQVAFMKVDSFGNALNGAKFTLYTDSSCDEGKEYKQNGTIITAESKKQKPDVYDGTNWSNNKEHDGIVLFDKVAKGIYFMKETEVPTGAYTNKSDGNNEDKYVVIVGKDNMKVDALEGKVSFSTTDNEKIKAALSAQNHAQKTESNGDYGDKTYAIFKIVNGKADVDTDIVNYGLMNANTSTRKVITRKVDGSNTPLEGAKFALYNYDMSVRADDNLTTSKDSGAFFIGDLPYGTYYLHENRPNDRWFTMNVSEDGTSVSKQETTTPSRTKHVVKTDTVGGSSDSGTTTPQDPPSTGEGARVTTPGPYHVTDTIDLALIIGDDIVSTDKYDGVFKVTAVCNGEELENNENGGFHYYGTGSHVYLNMSGTVTFTIEQVGNIWDGSKTIPAGAKGSVTIEVLPKEHQSSSVDVQLDLNGTQATLTIAHVADTDDFDAQDVDAIAEDGGLVKGSLYVRGTKAFFCCDSTTDKNSIRYSPQSFLIELPGFAYNAGSLTYTGTIIDGNTGTFNAGRGDLVKQNGHFYVQYSYNGTFENVNCDNETDRLYRIY